MPASRQRPQGDMFSVLKKPVFFLALSVFVLIVFANSLSNGFAFDDISTIKNNPAIRSSEHVLLFFTRPFFLVGQPVTGPILYDYYRPMVLVSYLVDYLFWNLAPKGWHITNVFLHITASLLVLLLFLRLRLDPEAAFAAATIYAVHPAIADSVAGVSGRSDPLCAIFFFASICCYISARHKGLARSALLHFLSVAFFALALLSKENAIVVPVLLLAFELLRPDRSEKSPLRFLLPFVAVATLYVLWRSHVIPTTVPFPDGLRVLILRLMTFANVAMTYIVMSFIPRDLGFETFVPLIDSVTDPKALLSTAAVLLIVGATIILARRFPRPCFFVMWFFVCLAPFSYFFLFHPGAEFFAPPHFLYFPLVGLAALVGTGAARLAERIDLKMGKRYGRTVFVVIGLIAILLGAQTRKRNTIWHDDFTFFSAMKEYAPRSSRVRIGLANSLMKAGLPGHALPEYARAWELARSEPEEHPEMERDLPEATEGRATGRLKISNYYAAAALAGMGDAYRLMGEYENSITSYRAALSENPFKATTHFKLARAYERAGHFDEAIDSYERALRIDTRLTGANSSLEIVREKKRLYATARNVYQNALRVGQADSAEGLYSEAILARLSSERVLAEALLKEALRKDPEHFGANMAFGRMQREKGNCEVALGNFGVAFATRPASAQAAYELAVTNLALRDILLAEQWAAKAYELSADEYYRDFLLEVRGREVSERVAQ